MGTHAAVIVKNDKGYELTRVYIHYDGYPEGVGVDIAKYLNGFTIGNGAGQAPNYANGEEELAAKLVHHLKQGSPNGNVYLIAKQDDWSVDYIYHIQTVNEEVKMQVFEASSTKADTTPLSGVITPAEFIEQF